MHRRLALADTTGSGVTPHGRSTEGFSNVAGRLRRARALIEEADALIERGEQLLDAADALLNDVCDRAPVAVPGEPSTRK